MATGANYPTSFDSYANKVTGDYLTIADVNSRSDAIEALETGPLRPNDGSVSIPTYSFQSSTSTGMYRSAANTLDFTAGGVRVLSLVTTASGVNFLIITPSATGSGPTIRPEGTDTNIPMAIDTKGTGLLQLRAGGNTVAFFTTAASAVNYWQLQNAATTGTPLLLATGTDTDVSAAYNTKGTGVHAFQIGSISAISIQRLLSGGGLLFSGESTSSWGSPGANNAYLYLRDNGSGKTRLEVEFNTGGPVVIATEP